MASIGKITGVNGNLIRVKFESAVSQNEVAYAKLISKNEAGKTENLRVNFFLLNLVRVSLLKFLMVFRTRCRSSLTNAASSSSAVST